MADKEAGLLGPMESLISLTCGGVALRVLAPLGAIGGRPALGACLACLAAGSLASHPHPAPPRPGHGQAPDGHQTSTRTSHWANWGASRPDMWDMQARGWVERRRSPPNRPPTGPAPPRLLRSS